LSNYDDVNAARTALAASVDEKAFVLSIGWPVMG
jgi:hypothetical protein